MELTDLYLRDKVVDSFLFIAGPCSVESEEQILNTARQVKRSGGHILRGGAFKPRTSPHSFQGLKEEGLKLLAKARSETGLPIVTEVLDPRDVPLVAEYADILQVGSRSTQNYPLLIEVAAAGKPVLLKRGMAMRVEEWLSSAEYLIAHGNSQVILCERGIRTFESATRHTLDLASVAYLKAETNFPVVVDPSHGTGRAALVPAMAKAALAAGADGVMIEVHPEPEKALSDGYQSLDFPSFERLMSELHQLSKVFYS